MKTDRGNPADSSGVLSAERSVARWQHKTKSGLESAKDSPAERKGVSPYTTRLDSATPHSYCDSLRAPEQRREAPADRSGAQRGLALDRGAGAHERPEGAPPTRCAGRCGLHLTFVRTSQETQSHRRTGNTGTEPARFSDE